MKPKTVEEIVEKIMEIVNDNLLSGSVEKAKKRIAATLHQQRKEVEVEMLKRVVAKIKELYGDEGTFNGSFGYQGMINGITSYQMESDKVRDQLLSSLRALETDV